MLPPKVFTPLRHQAPREAGRYLLQLEQQVHRSVRDLIEAGQHGVRKAHRLAGDGKTELYVSDTDVCMFKAFIGALLRLEEVDGRLCQLDRETLATQSLIFDLVAGAIMGKKWTYGQDRAKSFFGCQEPTDIGDTGDSSQEF
jgi:hypothetical protein